MVAKIIDGKLVARSIRAECKERVRALTAATGTTPKLAVILVGDNAASRVYVKNKIRAAEEVGILSELCEFKANVSQEAIVKEIVRLNDEPETHGILVQLPLPPHVDLSRILHTISVDKDVDGFHLYNVGGLVVGGSIYSPCTPYGVMKILDFENISVEGMNVVIVGASNIVGKPMAMMMMTRHATVAVCHVKTRDLAQFTILADILVVAAGHPNLILPQMVKTGSVVIDVGINRLPDGRLVGDVDFEGVCRKASHITPVPGGVGPMTITMLLSNTISAAENAARHSSLSSSFVICKPTAATAPPEAPVAIR
jgi:methylenetetrahydrofolate dehydrogenase (NADP+) / methenyltetrahydrofolate cyclohydrolase